MIYIKIIISRKKKRLFNYLVIIMIIGNKFKIYKFENENLNFMKFLLYKRKTLLES